MKKVFNVDSACKDMRIDRWFRLKISKLPQSLIEKYLRNVKIKVNNKKDHEFIRNILNEKADFKI